MSLTSIIIAGLALGVGLMILRANQSGPPVEAVGKGGKLQLRGFGPNGEDVEITVYSRHEYTEDDGTWIELEGESQFGPISLSYEATDPLNVDVTVRRIKLDDLELTPEKLTAIERADEGLFLFEGQRYEYEDWSEAVYHEHGDPTNRERLKYWEFESDSGNRITVERWEDGGFECFVSKSLSRSEVRVWSTTGEA